MTDDTLITLMLFGSAFAICAMALRARWRPAARRAMHHEPAPADMAGTGAVICGHTPVPNFHGLLMHADCCELAGCMAWRQAQAHEVRDRMCAHCGQTLTREDTP